MLTTTAKWISAPLLLIVSLFSFYAASYAPLLDCTVCIGAIAVGRRAARLHEYFWGAALLAITVAFSPLVLGLKLFLLLGLSCAGALITVMATFRVQPAPAV